MNNIQGKGSRRVREMTRDAVVGATDGMRALQKKTAELTAAVGKRWDGTKPGQQRAADALKRAVWQMVTLGKDVRGGLQEGIAEAKKRGKMKGV